MHRTLLSALVMAGFALAIPLSAQTSATPPPSVIPGFDARAMDTSANPCNDFYQYACGNYAKLHPIPADQPSYDQFVSLYEFNLAALRGLVEQAEHAGPDRTPNQQKIGDYYAACMDVDAINKAGLAPLEPELHRIEALQSKQELPALAARLNRLIDFSLFVNFGSQQDYKDATRQIAAIDQGGLGLPEKDYYLRTDAKSVELRREYVTHLANVLKLLGDPADKAQSEAAHVMAFETELAKASQGVVERRDPHNIYHIEQVSAFAPTLSALDVPEYLRLIGSPSITSLNVVSPDFFKGLNAAIEQTDLATLKTYMRVHLADSLASRLPAAFYDERFNFYGRELQGTPQEEARWKRCVNSVDGSMGEALGQLYVQQYFTPDMKQATLQMVQGIEAAMNQDIDQVDWMSPETKVKAKQKLQLITNKIGYPNKWRDYSKLDIKPGDALGNSLRAVAFATDYDLHKIGKPVDRGEWQMTPPTVNAYYDPSMNNINFPAGILQPPFYDKHAPDPVNYGHIGAVVGHELTHGFDDQGSQFDGEGNLHDWWTPADRANFDKRTACLTNEYSQFTAVDNLKVNGKLTLGENTADNGGLRLALMAMLARMAADNGKMGGPAPDAAEAKFTPEQQLFLGYAQNWCSNERPEYVRLLVQTDPHSPDAIRVKGVLTNMPEFAHAFKCQAGSPMAPAQRCRVW
jgi:putative endopeptidase